MRGRDKSQSGLFSYVSLEDRIPSGHPLRRIRKYVDAALESLCEEFEELYSEKGRPSIAPERLLRALLLQVLYSIRSERQLVEQLNYNLLFRWFVGLELDDPVWNATTFTKNRDRLLKGEVSFRLFEAVLSQARGKRMLSKDHFTVDGTLIEAWASQQSFQPKDDSDPGDGSQFHGQRRSNKTHQSKTDPESRLARKGAGKEAKLSYQGNVVIENRNGLIVETELTICEGNAETNAGLQMLERLPGSHRVTVGADKAYDNTTFVEGCREREVTPHVMQSTKRRRSRIDKRTTRHAGYDQSVHARPRVEGPIGWLKEYGMLRRPKFRGRAKLEWTFTFAAMVFNLVRMNNLEPA